MNLSRCQLSAANRERSASSEMNYRLTHSCYLTPEWPEVVPENSVCGKWSGCAPFRAARAVNDRPGSRERISNPS
jgi:hypothetical protein